MKANINSDGSVTFEVTGDSESDIFKEIARIQEIFNHRTCGKCQCEHTRFVCRTDKQDNDWLEVVCQDPKCRAKLVYGQTKKNGQIYPKIKWDQLSEEQQKQRAAEQSHAEKHFGYLPNNGWFIYKHPPKTEE